MRNSMLRRGATAVVALLAFAVQAWAVTITKPMPPPPPPPPAQPAPITAVTDGPTCTLGICGHYATASGTGATYVWSVTPAGAATLDTTIDPKNHTIRFMAVRTFARNNGYQSFTLNVYDPGDQSSASITVWPISLDFVKTSAGPGGTTLRDAYTRNDRDRVVHAPKDRDDPDSDHDRDFQVEVTGMVPVADLEFVTWSLLKGVPPNQSVGQGKVKITEHNGSSANVVGSGCSPHPSVTTPLRNVYRINTTIGSSWNPGAPPGTVEGTVHTFTLEGDAQSSFWDDIEIDVGIRQTPARLFCADGVGDSMAYTVPRIDVVLDTMNESEEGSDPTDPNDTASAFLLYDKDDLHDSDLEFTMKKVLPEEDLPQDVFELTVDVVDTNGASTTRAKLQDDDGNPLNVPYDRTANDDLDFEGLIVPDSKSTTREDTRIRVHLESGGEEVGGDTCRDSAYLTVFEADIDCPRYEAGGAITTPHTAAVDGNEFAFDGTATGVITIEWKMTLDPNTATLRDELDGQLIFGMTAIGESDRQWQDGWIEWDATESEWNFSGDLHGLPTDNTDFENNFTQVTLKSDHSAYNSCVIKRHIEVFFDATATNHPGAGAGTTPNWYYYWSKTLAGNNGSTTEYDSTAATPTIRYDDDTEKWIAVMNDDAFTPDYTPPQGDNSGTLLKGIDNFAHAMRHEARHVVSADIWYPDDYDASVDTDGDWFDDVAEAAASGTAAVNNENFVVGTVDTDADGYRDEEDYTYHTQAAWTVGDADDEDWSKDGKNWNQ